MSWPPRRPLEESDSDDDWVDRGSPEWRYVKEQRLAGLEGMKVELMAKVDELIKEVSKVNRDNRMKEEEARKLTKKLEKLKEGGSGRTRPSPVNEEGQQSGSGEVGVGPAQVEGHPKKAKVVMDAVIAVAILPEEVWKMIVGLVADSQDLWNLCNTCQLFEALLRPWKTGWMLEQALPYLWKDLPGNKLLECRLVSKSWSAAVDSFLEDHPSLRPHNEEQSDPRRLDFIYPLKEKSLCHQKYYFIFNNEEYNINCSASVDDPNFPKKEGRNPFIGRYVKLQLGRDSDEDDEDQPEDPWWDQLYSFLDTFGKEIWYLHLIFPDKPNPRVQAKLILFLTSKLFQSLPNLRKLNLDYRSESFPAVFEQSSFPTAPKLETLEAPDVGDNDDPAILAGLIQAYRTQLRKLHLLGKNCELISIHSIDLPNLQELVLDIGRYSVFEDPHMVHEQLHTLKEIRRRIPNLSKLQLNFLLIEGYSYFFEHLLDVINKLTTSTKLKTLRLGGDIQGMRFARGNDALIIESDHPRSRPSTIKTLEIDWDWRSFSSERGPSPNYNFLIRCFPQLENLITFTRGICFGQQSDFDTEADLMAPEEVIYWAERKLLAEEVESEVVKVHKHIYDGEMYKSNIWELLPRLKLVTFQWEAYTREGFEAYSRNQEEITPPPGED